MFDGRDKSLSAETAIDRLASARREVDAASQQVSEVSRHFRNAIDPTDRSPLLRFVANRVRSMPLTMLAAAFVAGTMLVRRR